MTEFECKEGEYQVGHERYNRLHTPCPEQLKCMYCGQTECDCEEELEFEDEEVWGKEDD